MPLFLLLLALPLVGEAQVRPDDSPFALRYRAVVDAYRTGRGDASVTAVLGLDHKALMGLVDRYVMLGDRGFPSDPALDEAFFRAASLLHADAAFRCWDEWGDEQCWSHLNLARRLVDVSERPGSKAGSFRRRWYAATSLIVTRHVVAEDALEYFDVAITRVPDDVALLTAAGWFAERLSNRAATPDTSVRNAQTLRRRHQQRAVQFLTTAVRIDPTAAEASLRLARIEASSGQREAARQRLTGLLARQDLRPSDAYLARLMLGDIRERDGDRREAARLYREAIALDSIAQSARVALAHLSYASGDAAGAAAVIEPLVTRTARPEANDPWSEYLLAYPVAGQMLLDQLRQEVQR
jgi:tetratricopeptide (TPR) repeat protein